MIGMMDTGQIRVIATLAEHNNPVRHHMIGAE